jgi:quercetin dioxygenase-like cupin family protein
MSVTTELLNDNPTSHYLILDHDNILDLGVVANALRDEIAAKGEPLAKKVLATQTGVIEVLLVVRDHEEPHTHPHADLIFTLLEGAGWLQRSLPPNPETNIAVRAGSTVVVPKGACHAFHNTSPTDSVLLATFSPADPTPTQGCARSS